MDGQIENLQLFLFVDVWFEMTPDECGYSLARAFVDSTYFESQFVNGKLSKRQPENDMLYLQGNTPSKTLEIPGFL